MTDRGTEARTTLLLRGLQSSGLCVLSFDPDLRLRLVENPPPGWPPAADLLARGVSAIFDPFTAERVLAAKRAVLASGTPQQIEALLRRDGADPCWFQLALERDTAPDGSLRGLFAAVTDITGAKRRETALRELLVEVSHRSRNLLAILQSILGQTASTAGSVAEFEEKFRGRIASLARGQDLITFANWQGVRFSRLAEAQTAPFAEERGLSLTRSGADPILTPHAALHLGLALHELAANAAAFGSHGVGAGAIALDLARHDGGWRLTWAETPACSLPARGSAGFGRVVLETVVPRALLAEASLRIGPDGLRYQLDLPPGTVTDG